MTVCQGCNILEKLAVGPHYFLRSLLGIPLAQLARRRPLFAVHILNIPVPSQRQWWTFPSTAPLSTAMLFLVSQRSMTHSPHRS